ncbi:hypothetical protein K501DRAFT_287600 [Backusella circina FSU 941]|nr:hypothetical protein K501DRAFT_287600 [Backusella circina FSU 941]
MLNKYSSLKVTELKESLKNRGLRSDGNKEDLVARLVNDDELIELEKIEKELGLVEDLVDVTVDLKDLDEEEILKPIVFEPKVDIERVLSDDDGDIFDDEIPKPVKVVSKVTSEKRATSHANLTRESVLSDDEEVIHDSNAPVSALDKKKKETVVVESKSKENEDEASERKTFAFKPIVFDNVKKTTEEKKKDDEEKARAERVRVDEQKRVERLKRFGKAEKGPAVAPNTQGTPKAKVDLAKSTTSKPNIEKETLKKRAERFGLPLRHVSPESSSAALNKNNNNKPGNPVRQESPENSKAALNRNKNKNKAGQHKNIQQHKKVQQNNTNNNKRVHNGQQAKPLINHVNRGRVNKNGGKKQNAREMTNAMQHSKNVEQKTSNNKSNSHGQRHNIGGRSVTIGTPVISPTNNANNRYQQQPRRNQQQVQQRRPPQQQQQQPRGQKRRNEQQHHSNKKQKQQQ